MNNNITKSVTLIIIQLFEATFCYLTIISEICILTRYLRRLVNDTISISLFHLCDRQYHCFPIKKLKNLFYSNRLHIIVGEKLLGEHIVV